MSNDVWVLTEYQRDEVQSVTFEMLDEGRKIAGRLKGSVISLVISPEPPDSAAALASHGADLVYSISSPLLAEYTTYAYVCALETLIREREPFLLLIAATANGRDLAPRLAARLGTGLASDCTMVKLNAEGAVEATRPTHRDRVYTTVVLTSPPPFLATFRPGAVGVGKPDLSRRALVESLSVEIDPSAVRTKVLRTARADPSSLDVAEAEIVVSGGRGIGSAQNWRLVEELAAALGASVGGSRMAMDEGWMARERLVGQTGKSVGPRLYVALGISGAKEHVLGTREARNVVAINKDPSAPIFGVADKAVVGDVREVVPVLVRKLKELAGRGAEADNAKDQSAGEGNLA